MPALLEQFLAQDCTPDVRQLLEDAISNAVLRFPHFEFNRFDIVVDRSSNTVRIEDDLDPSPEGKQTIRLDEFLASLARRSAEQSR